MFSYMAILLVQKLWNKKTKINTSFRIIMRLTLIKFRGIRNGLHFRGFSWYLFNESRNQNFLSTFYSLNSWMSRNVLKCGNLLLKLVSLTFPGYSLWLAVHICINNQTKQSFYIVIYTTFTLYNKTEKRQIMNDFSSPLFFAWYVLYK